MIPAIAGQAWITGFYQMGMDPTDPYPQGFARGRHVDDHRLNVGSVDHPAWRVRHMPLLRILLTPRLVLRSLQTSSPDIGRVDILANNAEIDRRGNLPSSRRDVLSMPGRAPSYDRGWRRRDMIAARPLPRLALVVLLFAPLLLSSNMLAARWVEGSVPPVALAFGRWLLTLVFLLPFTTSRAVALPRRNQT